MSVWGKVIGGVAGFAIGGPFGALLGTLAGHTVDRARSHAGEADTNWPTPALLLWALRR